MIEPLNGIDKELQYLYSKSIDTLKDFAEQTPSDCLSVVDVLKAHFLIANFFQEEGTGLGGVGTRSDSTLASAIARQWTGFGGTLRWSTVFERAATLMFGIISNHPFHDVNKRTALLSTAHYLVNNGYMITLPEKELELFAVRIASHSLNEYKRFESIRKNYPHDPEVQFIAWYLRHGTRKKDHKRRIINYRDLDRILKHFNYYLDDIKGGQVIIYRDVESKKGFWNRKLVKDREKCHQIPFRKWNGRVSQDVLKGLRKQLKLTAKEGCDNAAFFEQAEGMNDLIFRYNGALQRLSNK